MVRAEVSTTIDRPIREVFEYVREAQNIPKWDEDLLKVVKTSEGEFAIGTQFHLDIKPFMGETEGHGEVVGYDPEKMIELKFEMGKLKPHVWHLFAKEGPATRFTRVVEIEPQGFMKLMAPMMGRMIRKKNLGYLAKLKSLLEN